MNTWRYLLWRNELVSHHASRGNLHSHTFERFRAQALVGSRPQGQILHHRWAKREQQNLVIFVHKSRQGAVNFQRYDAAGYVTWVFLLLLLRGRDGAQKPLPIYIEYCCCYPFSQSRWGAETSHNLYHASDSYQCVMDECFPMRWKGILSGKRPRGVATCRLSNARAAVAPLLGEPEQQHLLFRSDVAAGRRQVTAGRRPWVCGAAGYVGMTLNHTCRYLYGVVTRGT